MDSFDCLENWEKNGLAGTAIVESKCLPLYCNRGTIQISARPAVDRSSVGKMKSGKIKESDLLVLNDEGAEHRSSSPEGAGIRFIQPQSSVFPWLSAPEKVEIRTPLKQFWASSRSGNGKIYFDESGLPLVGVSVFYAIASRDFSDRVRAVYLLRKEKPDLVSVHRNAVFNVASEKESFERCVKEWLFARAKENKLLETNAEAQIVKKRFEDTSLPRFRCWTKSNMAEAERGYSLSQRIFFEALNGAILGAEGVPFLSEVRGEYERIVLLHNEKHLAEWQTLQPKVDPKTVTLEDLQSQKSIAGPSIQSFDKVIKKMGFDWLPKEREVRGLRENLRFYRLKMEV